VCSLSGLGNKVLVKLGLIVNYKLKEFFFLQKKGPMVKISLKCSLKT